MTRLKHHEREVVEDGERRLRAGAAKTDITTNRKEAKIKAPLYAKALVLDDGRIRLALVSMDVTAIGGRAIGDGRRFTKSGSPKSCEIFEPLELFPV